MKNNFIILIICVICSLAACKNKETVQKTDEQLNIPLYEHVFLNAPSWDSLECKTYGECDCCAGFLVFDKDSTFFAVDYCESEEQLSKGTFAIANKQLHLHFNGIAVLKSYNWERENAPENTTLPEFFYKRSQEKPYTQVFDILNCGGMSYFKGVDSFIGLDTLTFKTKADYIVELKKTQLLEIAAKNN